MPSSWTCTPAPTAPWSSTTTRRSAGRTTSPTSARDSFRDSASPTASRFRSWPRPSRLRAARSRSSWRSSPWPRSSTGDCSRPWTADRTRQATRCTASTTASCGAWVSRGPPCPAVCSAPRIWCGRSRRWKTRAPPSCGRSGPWWTGRSSKRCTPPATASSYGPWTSRRTCDTSSGSPWTGSAPTSPTWAAARSRRRHEGRTRRGGRRRHDGPRHRLRRGARGLPRGAHGQPRRRVGAGHGVDPGARRGRREARQAYGGRRRGSGATPARRRPAWRRRDGRRGRDRSRGRGPRHEAPPVRRPAGCRSPRRAARDEHVVALDRGHCAGGARSGPGGGDAFLQPRACHEARRGRDARALGPRGRRPGRRVRPPARQGADPRQGLPRLRLEPPRGGARARGDAHAGAGSGHGGGHRQGDGAGLQPPDGAPQADGPRGARRAARDRGVPAPHARGAAIRAAADPARQGLEGRARKEGGKGVLLLERLTRITDVHIHIQPWRDLKPQVAAAMRRDKEQQWELLTAVMDDPRALLEIMDRAGVWRVGLVNYPAPDVMGFTVTTNDFAARYARANPERLLPYGGVHPRHTSDPAGDVDRLIDLGLRLCKIHPPHQGFPANAYTDGLDALGAIYRRAEQRGLPVMVHTGTSVFPGARSKYGNPMELDDVAIDFPDLQLVMAHGGRPLYMEEAFFILRRHPQVRLDVSGIPPC